MTDQIIQVKPNKKKLGVGKFLKKNVPCWLYVLPVVLGLLLFTLVPMVTSIIFAFSDFDPTEPDPAYQLSNFGVQHFMYMFNPKEELFPVLKSLYVTFRYVIVSLSLQIVGSYCVALFLNQQTKGVHVFRIIYYLPNLIPAVAGTLLWKDILSASETGYINMILGVFHIEPFPFYSSPKTVLPTMLFTGIFSWGGTAIMWLAQMQNVPKEMYESADLDGAGYFWKTFRITIPMTTSMLFYVIVTSIIGGIQQFSGVYPLLSVAGDEVRFIVVKIYEFAYDPSYDFGMSRACALSWILFVVIGSLTCVMFKTSGWVYYGEES